MNVLSDQKQSAIRILLERGTSQRQVAALTGVHRNTVKRLSLELSKCTTPATGSEEPKPAMATCSGDQSVPPRPPAFIGGKEAKSACEVHREWIGQQVGLGRNAQAIYQDLVEMHGFANGYNSVKRFVRKLKRKEPERFDILEYGPGEEAQVDYGEGAPVEGGKRKRPYLFVMTLKYSGKSFRKVTWKTNQYIWAKLHEEAFRSFGGCPRFVVLDNLKEGVLKPDIYEPELNKVYAAMLSHYGVVAQPCRVRDPNRKGTVERAIQHTQDTALKGKTFTTIEKQNEWLAHWEERWAAPRIHGSKKRQVLEMFNEEKPHLLPLPAAGFRTFSEEERRVDDAGLIQVKGNRYYAGPVPLYTPVKVRIYEDEIAIIGDDGAVVRRERLRAGKGKIFIDDKDRIFNPSRETVRLIEKIKKIGPSAALFAGELFARQGRASQGTIYGLIGLTRTYRKDDIERACASVLKMAYPSYRSVKTILERTAKPGQPIELQQHGADIRPVDDYQRFWDLHARSNNQEETEDGNDVERDRQGIERLTPIRDGGHP